MFLHREYGYTKAEKTREAWVGSGRVRSGRPDPHLPVFLLHQLCWPVPPNLHAVPLRNAISCVSLSNVRGNSNQRQNWLTHHV